MSRIRNYYLQAYEDGTFGYLKIDGNELYNLTTESKVVNQQKQNESREDFISRCDIIFKGNEYGSNEEFDRIINNNDTSELKDIIAKGYGLDKLVHFEKCWVRQEIARNGYLLDILINDPEELVRGEVAKQGYSLDILIKDKSYYVRREVAKQGYGLDILINDPNEYVRREVIYQGYGLDIAVRDTNPINRKLVADKGQYLDILVHDEDKNVRYSVALQNYGFDILVYDPFFRTRQYIAKQGQYLDILVDDKNIDVRSEVAKHGYGLEKLVNDTDDFVVYDVIEYAIEHNLSDILEVACNRTYNNTYCERLLIAYGYIADDKIEEKLEDVFDTNKTIYIIKKKSHNKHILDLLYLKATKQLIPHNLDTIKTFENDGYDISVFRLDKDVNIRKYLLDVNNHIDDYVDDRSSDIRYEVYAKFANEFYDEERIDFINRNIAKLVKYEKYYSKILMWAIDHNVQVEYIMLNTKSDNIQSKILDGDKYVSNMISIDKLKTYHLNIDNAHCFRNRNNQYYTLSKTALQKGEIKVILTSSSSDTDRIAMKGAKVRNDGYAGCQDGTYYKVLDCGKNFGEDGFYIHKSIFIGMTEVMKGIFEELD